MSVFLAKVCTNAKTHIVCFYFDFSRFFVKYIKEKLHFLKRLMVPMANFLDLIVFFFFFLNKTLQPAHLLCLLDGVLKLGFPCLFTVH